MADETPITDPLPVGEFLRLFVGYIGDVPQWQADFIASLVVALEEDPLYEITVCAQPRRGQ